MSSDLLTVGTAAARPGQRATGHLVAGQHVDGSPIRIPLHLVCGAQPGPVLWAQGACHGDEYDGTAAILRLLGELDPARMAGSLVAVPVANLSAYLNASRVSPVDGKDLNRFYPGDPQGTYTDRLAHLLQQEVSRVASHFIEHHGGGNTHDVVYYTLHCSHPGPTEAVRAMCDAMGAPIVWASQDTWLQNSLFHRLHTQGIKAVLLECGGEGRLHRQNVQDHYDGLRNLMIHLGMLPGQAPANAQPVQHRVKRADFFFSEQGGLVTLLAGRGAVIERDQPLALITDLSGSVVETFRCRVDRGIILAIRTYGTVPSGGSVALVGQL